MKNIFLYIVLLVMLVSCEKEYSIENPGGIVNTATGTLQDSAGNCQAIEMQGIYKENVALTSENFIKANINFTAIGNFRIYTDTVNGYYFNVENYAFSTGLKTITIYGAGKPIMPVDAHFKLHFGSSVCYFTVKNNASITTQPATNNDYFPTTTSSNWTYNNSTIMDTAIISILPVDRTINGNIYRQFALYVPKLLAADTLYYRKDGFGSYYRYYAIGSGPKTDFIFLKDFAAVGASWDSPTVTGSLSGTPTDVKYHFTIVDKNVTAIIGAFTIDSIITVKEETQYFESGAFNTKNTFIYSYAKKKGLVDLNQQNAIPNITAPVTRWNIY